MTLNHNTSSDIEKIKQRLVKLMLISIIITFTLFLIVIIALIYKFKHDGVGNKVAQEQTINLPPNSSILSENISDGKLFITIMKEGNYKIIIYDYNKAKVISTLNINNPIS